MKTFSIIAAIVLIAANQPNNEAHLGRAETHDALRPASTCTCDASKQCVCDTERIEGQMQLLASELGKAVERIKSLESENAAMKAASREPEYRIVMYGADWCGPCHALKRTLDAAGIKYDYIDTTADESEAWRDLGVTVFPTMFLVENDVIQTGRKVVGSVSAATVRQSYPEAFK
jgi:glutaredoxin